MRKITKRQFQQNFHKELENLPFTVTKHGEDYYVVTSANDVTTFPQSANIPSVFPSEIPDIKSTLTTASTFPDQLTYIKADLDKINFPTAEQMADPNFGLARKRATSKCNPQNATCKFFGTKYRVTYSGDEGEIKKDVFLCEFHAKKAIDSGLEVMEK